MKNYRVTVNGSTYDVAVEELGVGATIAPVQVASPTPVALVSPPIVQAPVPVVQSVAATSAQKINSPMPGTILDIKVKEGDVLSENQVVIILEAMKMENEIVTPFAGKVASINVLKGASVNSGDLLLSIE